MFTKDYIRTVTNVIIVYPMQTDLLFQSCAIQGYVTSDAIQAKERSYYY
jgi:hypothetical protein